MSPNARQREMMNLLKGRRHESVSNLAFHFGVSVSTIKRDIGALMDDYQPIETHPGPGGGVRITEDYLIFKNDISKEQQKLLLSLMKTLDNPDAELIRELLRSHGSRELKEELGGYSPPISK